MLILRMSSKYKLVYTIRIPANAEAPVVKAAMEECAVVVGKVKKTLKEKYSHLLAD